MKCLKKKFVMQAIEEKLRKELLQLDADYRASKKLYFKLCEDIKHLKAIYEQIEAKKKLYNARQEELAAIREQLKNCRDTYNAILTEEIEMVNTWCCPAYEQHSAEKDIQYLCAVRDASTKEVAGINFQNLRNEKAELEEQLQKWIEEIKEIQQQLAGLERECILQAKVIGTTLAKSYLNDTLHERTFDGIWKAV